MTGLGQWLAGVLNRHIERHNMPAVDPLDRRAVLDALARADEAKLIDAMPSTDRPCWACGDPAGFHREHYPCWKVPPFTRNGDPPQRTYGAGGLL